MSLVLVLLLLLAVFVLMSMGANVTPIPPVFIIITLVITPDILHLAPALPHFPRTIEELKIEFAYYSNKDSHIIDYCMPKPSDGYFETQHK